MTDDDNMRRVPIFLRPETADAVDQVADEFSLAKSEIIRDLVNKSLTDDEELSAAVKDAVDDDMIRIARKKRENARLKKLNQEADKVGGIVSGEHFRNRFRDRLEGSAPTPMTVMESLADSYREEAREHLDEWAIENLLDGDETVLDDTIEQIDQLLKAYEAGLFARKHSEAIDTELQNYDRNSSWLEIGEDLYRLRLVRDEVESIVRETSTSDAVDDRDDCAEWIAEKWTVDKAAAIIFLQEMTADGSSITAMLIHGGDHIVDGPALESADASSFNNGGE